MTAGLYLFEKTRHPEGCLATGMTAWARITVFQSAEIIFHQSPTKLHQLILRWASAWPHLDTIRESWNPSCRSATSGFSPARHSLHHRKSDLLISKCRLSRRHRFPRLSPSPSLQLLSRASTSSLCQLVFYEDTARELSRPHISREQDKSKADPVPKDVRHALGTPPPRRRDLSAQWNRLQAWRNKNTLPDQRQVVLGKNYSEFHFLPSSFALSISSGVMNPFILDLISMIRSMMALRDSAGGGQLAASSAMTSWFRLRLFRLACSFKRVCTSSGKFRIVNVPMLPL